MKRIVLALALLAVAAVSQAKDVKNGNAYVKAVAQDRFQIDGNPMAKNMLMAYLQDLKDSQHITGVVLSNPDKSSAEQRHLLKVMADFLKIDALSGDKLEPLAD